MIRTPKLEELCRLLSNYGPNKRMYRYVAKRFREHPDYDRDADHPIPLYIKCMAQLRLDICIATISEARPDLRISFDTGIRHDSSTSLHSYRYDKAGRLIAYPLDEEGHRAGGDFLKYDNVVLVNGLPVVFDLKLGRWNTGKRKQRDKRVGRGGGAQSKGYDPLDILQEQNYNRKLRPLRDFFQEDVGFVVMLAQDIYHFNKDSPIARAFEERRGVLMSHYARRDQLVQEVKLTFWPEIKDSSYRDYEVRSSERNIDDEIDDEVSEVHDHPFHP